jgi:hypothetical protein
VVILLQAIDLYIVRDIIPITVAIRMVREGAGMGNGTGATKGQRLAEILRRLAAATPAASHDEAYRLLCDTIDAVEDEMTTTPNNPQDYATDGRIYPPQADRRHRVKGRPDLVRYESRGHDTFIGDNGAITVARKDRTIALDKPGADGQGTRWGTRP